MFPFMGLASVHLDESRQLLAFQRVHHAILPLDLHLMDSSHLGGTVLQKVERCVPFTSMAFSHSCFLHHSLDSQTRLERGTVLQSSHVPAERHGNGRKRASIGD